MVNDGADNIGPVEAIATPAKVIFTIEVQRKWLATLQRYRAIETPSVFQALHTSSHLG